MALLRSYEDPRATLAKRSLFKISGVHLMKSCDNMIKSHLLCNSPLLFIASSWGPSGNTRSTKQTFRSGVTKEPLLQDQLVELKELVQLLNMQEGLYFFAMMPTNLITDQTVLLTMLVLRQRAALLPVKRCDFSCCHKMAGKNNVG